MGDEVNEIASAFVEVTLCSGRVWRVWFEPEPHAPIRGEVTIENETRRIDNHATGWVEVSPTGRRFGTASIRGRVVRAERIQP